MQLLMISHAATKEMRSGRFPADDLLDERAVAATQAWRQYALLPAQAEVFISAAACTHATAQLLGLNAQIAPALTEIDHGRWRGESLADVAASEPEALAEWMRDPTTATHGGESFGAALTRVGVWMDSLEHGKSVVAVTHTSILRAAIIHALDITPTAFARIEIGPLCLIQLSHSTRGWSWLPA